MALPNGWNPGDECPECGSRVWDNRGNKRNPKAPDFKCSNAECQGGNGRPWAAWADPPKAATRPAQRAAAPAAAPMTRKTITSEQFWSLLPDVLIQARQALTTAGLPIDQAREIAAQYFILVEHGMVTVPSTGPATQPQGRPEVSVGRGEQAYLEDLELCGSVEDIDKVMGLVRREVTDKVVQARLLGECLKMKRRLTTQEGVI